jgi:hypothetical protein
MKEKITPGSKSDLFNEPATERPELPQLPEQLNYRNILNELYDPARPLSDSHYLFNKASGGWSRKPRQEQTNLRSRTMM